MSGVKNACTYRWNVEDPTWVAQGLGVLHTVDAKSLFTPGVSSTPASYKAGRIIVNAIPVMQGS